MSCIIIKGKRDKIFKITDDMSLNNMKKLFKPTIIIENNKEIQVYNIEKIWKILDKKDYIFYKDTLCILTDKRKIKVQEVDVQNDIIKNLKKLGHNPISEVKCKYGRIDILTDNSIIEVKIAECYKHALGQILFYNQIYPKKYMYVYLFDVKKENIEEIREIYEKFNVKLIIVRNV